MDTFFSQLSLGDGGFFFAVGAGTIALVLFRRACQTTLACPKEIKIADYWGHYEQEKCQQCSDIHEISRIMKSSKPRISAEPAAYIAAHR